MQNKNLYQEILLYFDKKSYFGIQVSDAEKIRQLIVKLKNMLLLKGFKYLSNLKIISTRYNNFQTLDILQVLHL